MQPVTTIFLGPWGRMASCAWVVNLRRLHRLAIGAQVSNLPHMFFLLVLVANAQQVGQNAPASSAASTFQSSTQLVVETVSVKDKNGNAVENLTAKDFTVTEDGAPQTIKFFEFQKLQGQVPSAAPLSRAEPFAKLPKSHIAPESPGNTKYRDHRLLALYFDMSAMPEPDQLRAFSAAMKFIQTQMTASDLMALMVYEEGAVKILQDFTGDRDRLESIVETLIVGEDQNTADTANDASSADTGAAFGQDDSEFNIFNTDRQLAALQTAVNMLSHLNEKKSLIYFASGMKLNGVDNQAQMRAATNAAVRANVVLFPVDARGLVASSPMGDASKGSPGGNAMYSGGSAMAFTNNLQRSQDTLYALAADTGGKALLDFNDLSQGIVQAQKATNSYYILGYYSTNTALDGKFRKINISVKETSAKLDYRSGYFGGKTFNKFTTADKERQLEDALMLGDPITDLTISLEINYFQLNRAEYFVPLMMKIPGSELALARRGGAEHTVIEFIGEIKDDFGVTVQNIRDRVDAKLTGATAAELVKRPILYPTGYTLLPGKYSIKVLARDDETGRIGTYMHTFVIPNLNKEEKRIPISSVVLSSQRVALSDALFTASKDKVQTANPLVVDGQMLIPSVTRVFSRSRDMYIYLQAYEPTATATEPLVAFVSFYRGQTKAFETAPLPVTEGMANKLRTVPMRFNLSLDKLPPGRYDCQVSVVDPAAQKVAFWQAPVMLVP
jgi:VWFA-related protein